MTPRSTRHYRRRRAFALAYLGGRCERCGESDARLLEVDHAVKRLKRFDPFGPKWAMRFDDWRWELEVCQLLCSACHARRTAKQRAARTQPRKTVKRFDRVPF